MKSNQINKRKENERQANKKGGRKTIKGRGERGERKGEKGGKIKYR